MELICLYLNLPPPFPLTFFFPLIFFFKFLSKCYFASPFQITVSVSVLFRIAKNALLPYWIMESIIDLASFKVFPSPQRNYLPCYNFFVCLNYSLSSSPDSFNWCATYHTDVSLEFIYASKYYYVFVTEAWNHIEIPLFAERQFYSPATVTFSETRLMKLYLWLSVWALIRIAYTI